MIMWQWPEVITLVLDLHTKSTRLEFFDGFTFVSLLPICYLNMPEEIISSHKLLIFKWS
jgi:uncharacterized protein YqjF (DUF2071 family)